MERIDRIRPEIHPPYIMGQALCLSGIRITPHLFPGRRDQIALIPAIGLLLVWWGRQVWKRII